MEDLVDHGVELRLAVGVTAVAQRMELLERVLIDEVLRLGVDVVAVVVVVVVVAVQQVRPTIGQPGRGRPQPEA